MKKVWFPKSRLAAIACSAQILLGGLVILLSISTLFKFYSAGIFTRDDDYCSRWERTKDSHYRFEIRTLAARIDEVLAAMENLQDKLEAGIQDPAKKDEEHKQFIKVEVIRPLYNAYIALRQIRLPKSEIIIEAPLMNYFVAEEIRKYITPKKNRFGMQNVYKTEKIYNTIGHSCLRMKKELEEFMTYDIGSYCKDDLILSEKLMINGCEPLPRRRCLARASKFYQKPYPINESLWRIPNSRNARWSNYRCKSFDCFEIEKEKSNWMNKSSIPVDFLINDVLAAKPGEIRIGLDFGVSTGSFAARMKEKDVTIISTAMNVGAPFSEMIALRGLVPLHMTINQRLPFFDNTLDLVHTAEFLGNWIDLQLLDFILYDLDRVLRPGGLLWIDRFYCNRRDLDVFMEMFLQFKYKKHKWAVAPKARDEVYLSALLEKPPRS